MKQNLMNAVLSARGLRRTFSGSPALQEVDLDVAAGELVAIMGPSGSGKSTLLYAVSGMEAPDGGSIVLEGIELTTLDQKQLAHLRLTRLGFVFQQIHLLRNLTLLDNVVLPARLARTVSRVAALARARELMELTGVGELAERDITQASGGQLQRVGICRALINSPRIVFADEPTGALDSVSARAVMRLLAEIHADGATLVLVTHDADVAAHAQRVITMADGRIVGERRLGSWDGEEETLVERALQLSQDSMVRHPGVQDDESHCDQP